MDYNKPSHQLVVDLINLDNNWNFAYGDLLLPDPVAVNIHGRNTEVYVTGAPGSGYTGSRVIHYNRLDMAEVMETNDPEGLLVMVPNDGFVDTGEITERLNRMFNLGLAPSDVVVEELVNITLPYDYTLRAHAQSLAWRGTLPIQLVVDRPMWSDAVSTTRLDGLHYPDADVSALTTPVTTNNATLSFKNGENEMLYSADLPASGFVTSTNSEIEVAGCARVGSGGTAITPNSERTYTLPLSGQSTWCLPISIGLLSMDAGFMTPDLYDACVKITCPDDSELVLTLVRNGMNYTLVNTEKGISLDVDYMAADGSVYQTTIDMATLKPHLGTITSNASGAPLGVYMIRVQARRKNSIAPRVLSTFLVQAGNAAA